MCHQEAVRLEFAKGATKQDAMALYDSWLCLVTSIGPGSSLKPGQSQTQHVFGPFLFDVWHP